MPAEKPGRLFQQLHLDSKIDTLFKFGLSTGHFNHWPCKKCNKKIHKLINIIIFQSNDTQEKPDF